MTNEDVTLEPPQSFVNCFGYTSRPSTHQSIIEAKNSNPFPEMEHQVFLDHMPTLYMVKGVKVSEENLYF